MVDDYYMNLEKFTIEKYKQILEQSEMLPSRKILKEKVAERFGCLEKHGMKNLQDLVVLLKTTKKAKDFAEKSGLPEDYLLLLRREINSYQPKPVYLKKFPGIRKENLNKLESIGIKSTKQLYEKIKTKEERKQFAKQTGIGDEELLELTKLTDLSRVKWIGPVFARIFLESGTDTVEKVSKSKAGELYKKLVEINNKYGYTKGNFIENDVRLCINVAKDVPKTIEY